jgi:hypothetical protein
MVFRRILEGLPLVGNRNSIDLSKENIRKINRWGIHSKSRLLPCNSREPRYVYTDSSKGKDVVYTDSLIDCIGVLVYSEKNRVAGLCHSHAKDTYNSSSNRLTDNREVVKMVKEIESEYGKMPLRADIIIGDRPERENLQKTVETLHKFEEIRDSSTRIIYGGPARVPDFIKSKTRTTDTAAKLAYDTEDRALHVAPDT